MDAGCRTAGSAHKPGHGRIHLRIGEHYFTVRAAERRHGLPNGICSPQSSNAAWTLNHTHAEGPAASPAPRLHTAPRSAWMQRKAALRCAAPRHALLPIRRTPHAHRGPPSNHRATGVSTRPLRSVPFPWLQLPAARCGARASAARFPPAPRPNSERAAARWRSPGASPGLPRRPCRGDEALSALGPAPGARPGERPLLDAGRAGPAGAASAARFVRPRAGRGLRTAACFGGPPRVFWGEGFGPVWGICSLFGFSFPCYELLPGERGSAARSAVPYASWWCAEGGGVRECGVPSRGVGVWLCDKVFAWGELLAGLSAGIHLAKLPFYVSFFWWLSGDVQFFASSNPAVPRPARARRKSEGSEIQADCSGLITKGASPVRLPERMDSADARGRCLNSHRTKTSVLAVIKVCFSKAEINC